MDVDLLYTDLFLLRKFETFFIGVSKALQIYSISHLQNGSRIFLTHSRLKFSTLETLLKTFLFLTHYYCFIPSFYHFKQWKKWGSLLTKEKATFSTMSTSKQSEEDSKFLSKIRTEINPDHFFCVNITLFANGFRFNPHFFTLSQASTFLRASRVGGNGIFNEFSILHRVYYIAFFCSFNRNFSVPF